MFPETFAVVLAKTFAVMFGKTFAVMFAKTFAVMFVKNCAFAKALAVVPAEIFVMFYNFFKNFCSESFCFVVHLMFGRDTYGPPYFPDWTFPILNRNHGNSRGTLSG